MFQNWRGMQYKGFQLVILAAWVGIISGCGAKATGGGEADDKAAAAPAVVELTKVQLKTIQKTVSAQGVFAASQGGSVKVGAIAAGRLANVFAREGDIVQAGQLVAVVENGVQKSQLQSAQAGVSIAQLQSKESDVNYQSAKLEHAATVNLAKLALQTAKAEQRSAVKQARFDLQSAELDLKKAMMGGRPQEVAQAEQAERQAQVAKDAAEREEKRNALLLQHGIVSQKTYEDSKAALNNAVASLKSAQSQTSLVKEGPRPEDKVEARLKVEATKQALDSTIEVQDHKVLEAETSLRQAEQGELQVEAKLREAQASKNSISQKQADASVAQATQAQLEIRSPISGRVVRRFLNPGDTPDNNSPVLEILSPTAGLDLVASVPASSGSEIKAQMASTIKVTGEKTVELSGTIISVGQVDPQTGLMSIRIRAQSPPDWLRVGTFATAEIILSEHKGALAIPKAALLSNDGSPIVYVPKGDKAAMVKVEVGAEQDGFVEVLKGLTGNDSVVSLGNYEISDGAAIKVAGGDDKPESGEKKASGDEKKPDADDKKADDGKAGADKK